MMTQEELLLPLNPWRFLEYKDEVDRFINERETWCYGAGNIGKRFLEYCNSHDLRIYGFIVSDNQALIDKMKFDLPILHLSEFMDETREVNIVVTVTEAYQDEIRKNLHGAGIKKNIRYMRNLPYFMTEWFDEEMERRRKLDIFDFQELAKPFPLVSKERPDNAYYGQTEIIKKLFNYPMDVWMPDTVVHSPAVTYIGRIGYGIKADIENRYGTKIYVSSEFYKDFLQRALPNKEVISVGLYIQYAENMLSPEILKKTKNELGKTLLVFPTHSSSEYVPQYDYDEFINSIKYHGQDFDTVLVCMYCNDVIKGIHKKYEQAGFRIVTAGWYQDYNFLNRQRTFIELADMTMANRFDTASAYCVCLNRPHYIFHQDTFLKDGNCIKSCQEYEMEELEAECIMEIYTGYIDSFYEEMKSAFSIWSEELTNKQISFVKKYYGDWK